MKATFLIIAAAMLFSSCSKMAESVLDKGLDNKTSTGYSQYTILQGKQYCEQTFYSALETKELKFLVKFDSSAIYQTKSSGNQYDINKLFGFSDNNANHHSYSARIGWRWSEGALRLFAYVYNAGVVSSKELTTVNIGKEISCAIQAEGNQYKFIVNGVSELMPRLATTEKALGYQLFPYFGGDEAAPHQINIWIDTVEPAL